MKLMDLSENFDLLSDVSESRSMLALSSAVSSRGHNEGPSELMVDASYYNLYQPTPYTSYYSNLYNYQQYQVNKCAPHMSSATELLFQVIHY